MFRRLSRLFGLSRQPRGALLLPGSIPMSGKMGPYVFARNKGGQYVRTRVVPVNPNTSRQQNVRSVFALLSGMWNGLTEVQRAAWNLFGLQTPRTNRLGQTITISGHAAYVGSNSIRLQGDLTVVDDGPTVFNLATLTAPTPALSAGGGASSLTLTGLGASDDWQAPGGGLLLFTSELQDASTNFFKGPYKFRAVHNGGTVALSGVTLTNANGLPVGDAGQKVFYRIISTAPDGRQSPEVTGVAAFPA